MFFSLIKEINRLISKGMSNIYLKVAVEKKWRTQNFDLLSLKGSSPCQFLGGSNSHGSLNFQTCCYNLKIRGLEAKLSMDSLLF